VIFYTTPMRKKVFTTCFLQTDERIYLLFCIIFESIILYFRQVLNRIPTGFPYMIQYRNSCFIKVFRKKMLEINSFFSFLNIFILFIFLFLICFLFKIHCLFYRLPTIKYYFPISTLRFTIPVSD
jgi:hypothetical protein